MPGYKLILKNSKVLLKTAANYIINLIGIKDDNTGTGNVTNGFIDWKLQHFTDTAANLTSTNPTLLVGQLGIETDDLTTSPKFKIGDGVTAWVDLPYMQGSGGGGGVNLIREEFTYTSGAQTFTLLNTASYTYAVFVNGQELRESQYTAVATTLTIIDTLEANDRIDILYSDTTLGVNPSYTKNESDALLATKADIGSTLSNSEIISTDANGKLQTLPIATYPSLTELSYVKGVTSALQTQLNALSGARDRKYFAYDNTSFSYTGTTADTIVKTISIPENSMLANSTLDLFMNFFKSGTTNTQGMYLYITTNSGAITGGTRIGSNGQGGTTTLQYGKHFRLSNKNSQTSQLGQTSSNNAQDFSSPLAGAKQVLAIDFTVQQYIHIVTFLIGGSVDTIGISDYQMYIDHV